MSKTMSSRERMLAAITRQKPDYVPFSPWTNQGPRLGPPLNWLSQFHRAQRLLEAGKLHCYLLPEDHGPYASVLKNMGMDVLMGVDPRQIRACDMRALFDQFGDTKSFWGGVNAEVLLHTENQAQIEAGVRDAIESLGVNGGLALGALIFEDTPPNSILMMIDAWKRYRDVRSAVAVA